MIKSCLREDSLNNFIYLTFPFRYNFNYMKNPIYYDDFKLFYLAKTIVHKDYLHNLTLKFFFKLVNIYCLFFFVILHRRQPLTVKHFLVLEYQHGHNSYSCFTAPDIPRWSPIQVLTRPDAEIRWDLVCSQSYYLLPDSSFQSHWCPHPMWSGTPWTCYKFITGTQR